MTDGSPTQIEITPEMVARYVEYGVGYYSPCVICGGKFPKCHTIDQTEIICARIKKMGAKRRKQIIREWKV